MKQRAFEIIFEDDDILVINKRAGILSIPDRYHSDINNLYVLLKQYRKSIYPLHRLDKETSGVMVYAKTESSHKELSRQFENREIRKEYLTILEGSPENDEETIDTFLAPSLYEKDKMIVLPKKGKRAITTYRILERFKHFSFGSITINTGRQHQIRVHMKHIGHPLAVDAKYGNRKSLYAFDIKTNKFNKKENKPPKPLISRHSLHAYKITIRHPVNKEKIEFKAELPKDMRATLNQLRKWQKTDV